MSTPSAASPVYPSSSYSVAFHGCSRSMRQNLTPARSAPVVPSHTGQNSSAVNTSTWSRFQKGNDTPWMSALRPMAFTSSSKRGPSASFVTSSPLPSLQSTKDTPLPSEYMQRWTFRRLNRFDATRSFEAVKSSALAPVALYSLRTNRLMVTFLCR